MEKWQDAAFFRKENKIWLKYSGKISLRVLSAMEDCEGMTNQTLAEKLGTSPQYISKILKGKTNLTLKTISKLSEILSVDLICFPDFKYNNSDKII